MPKPNPLTQGVNSTVAVMEAKPTVPKLVPRTRNGRVMIGGFFAPDVSIALKVIAAQERTTVQALLTEGINTVFARRQQPEIAALSAGNQ